MNKVERFKSFVHGSVRVMLVGGMEALVINIEPRRNSRPICSESRFVLGVQGLEGNPYGGHSLNGILDQVAELTGIRPGCYVDRGYRGHGVAETKVFLFGQKRNVTPTIKKELKRRSVIGHQKTEGRLV